MRHLLIANGGSLTDLSVRQREDGDLGHGRLLRLLRRGMLRMEQLRVGQRKRARRATVIALRQHVVTLIDHRQARRIDRGVLARDGLTSIAYDKPVRCGWTLGIRRQRWFLRCSRDRPAKLDSELVRRSLRAGLWVQQDARHWIVKCS